ncbi:hypothetical protein [Roseiterribacter gracilis]|uniref:Holin-X, holin superfamily III n=1 Tax=Roseiterribacter gracilis TaxID=2812848 RepID=A0A8S8XCF9_9PROT|nr:hypothetical protein TMPK1_19990 [Rhodospirillales bacterium TMPK1]
MRGWLSLASGLGRDLLVGRVEAAKKNAVAAVIAYSLIAAFGVASLGFLYAAIWALLARRTDPMAATWIMLGINVGLMLLVYVIYRIYRSSVTRVADERANGARADLMTGASSLNLAFEAGRIVESGLKANAKTLVVGAIVLGLTMGLLGGRRRSDEDDDE